jgi:hypothetical protein
VLNEPMGRSAVRTGHGGLGLRRRHRAVTCFASEEWCV